MHRQAKQSHCLNAAECVRRWLSINAEPGRYFKKIKKNIVLISSIHDQKIAEFPNPNSRGTGIVSQDELLFGGQKLKSLLVCLL